MTAVPLGQITFLGEQLDTTDLPRAQGKNGFMSPQSCRVLGRRPLSARRAKSGSTTNCQRHFRRADSLVLDWQVRRSRSAWAAPSGGRPRATTAHMSRLIVGVTGMPTTSSATGRMAIGGRRDRPAPQLTISTRYCMLHDFAGDFSSEAAGCTLVDLRTQGGIERGTQRNLDRGARRR